MPPLFIIKGQVTASCIFGALCISGIDPLLNDYIELSNDVHDDATTGTENSVENDEVSAYMSRQKKNMGFLLQVKQTRTVLLYFSHCTLKLNKASREIIEKSIFGFATTDCVTLSGQ